MTTPALIAAGAVLVAWLLLQFKTSRPDGVLIRKLHPYRKLMAYVMPGRNESICLYDDHVRADRLLEYLERTKGRFPADVTHCLVGAAAIGLSASPTMNRFVVGRRLYARKRVEVTFSMKRKALDRRSKLAVVKMEVRPGESFESLCRRIDERIGVERTDQRTYADKEFGFFGLIPRPVLNLAVHLFRWLDYHNLLPGAFIEGDGLYTSMFIANLGSVGLGPAFHHLYEWGTCPLFMMAGRIEEKPVVEDGAVVARRILHLRWSYDERIDDGLSSRFGMEAVRRALEDPFTYLGCLDPAGSDARPLVPAETPAPPPPPGPSPEPARQPAEAALARPKVEAPDLPPPPPRDPRAERARDLLG